MKCGAGQPGKVPEPVIRESGPEAHSANPQPTPDVTEPRFPCEACGKDNAFTRHQDLTIGHANRLVKAGKIDAWESREAFIADVSRRTESWRLCLSCKGCVQRDGCDLCGASVVNTNGLRPEKMRRLINVNKYGDLVESLDEGGKLHDYMTRDEFVKDVQRSKSSNWELCNECLDLLRGIKLMPGSYKKPPAAPTGTDGSSPKAKPVADVSGAVAKPGAPGGVRGFVSFVSACVLTIVIHSLITGEFFTVAGIKWWDFLSLFLFWGLMDTVIKGIKGG